MLAPQLLLSHLKIGVRLIMSDFKKVNREFKIDQSKFFKEENYRKYQRGFIKGKSRARLEIAIISFVVFVVIKVSEYFL